MGQPCPAVKPKATSKNLSKNLWEAYSALRENDPLSLNAKNQLWRKLWALENVNAWISKGPETPRFLRELHKAIPDDDLELLREIQCIAKQVPNRSPALYILGLVNERLERCTAPQAAQRIPPPDSFAPSLQFSASSGFPMKLNYQGFVCVGVRYKKSADLPIDRLKVPRNSLCQLGVWMQPTKAPDFQSEELLIETGIDDDFVTFTFEVDCPSLPISYGRRRIQFHRKQKSDVCLFDFHTPKAAGEHLLYVHVLQEFDLVKSLLVVLNVGSSSRTNMYASPRA